MVQLTILNKANKQEFEETKEVLINSYLQYETLFGSEEGFGEYISTIKKSLYNEQIDQVFITKDEADGHVSGTLQLFLNSKKAYQIEGFDVEQPFIRLLAVSPTERNKGIARTLLDGTIDYLKNNGYREVYLHTSEIMVAAVRLYERYGFERFTDFDFHKENRLVTCYRYKILD